MSVIVDLLSDDELKEFGATDAPLARALKEYVQEEDNDYDEDDE